MGKSPARPRPTRPALAAAPESEEADLTAPTEETMDLPVEQVLSGYEQQIGMLTGQIIRQNIIIQGLRAALTAKSTPPESAG